MKCDCNCDYWLKEIGRISDTIFQEYFKSNNDRDYHLIETQTAAMNRFCLHLLGNLFLHMEDEEHYPYTIQKGCTCDEE